MISEDLRTLCRSLPDATLLVSSGGAIRLANDAAANLFGRSLRDLECGRIQELLDEDPVLLREALTRFCRTSSPIPEVLNVKENGATQPYRCDGHVLLRSDDGPVLCLRFRSKQAATGGFIALTQRVEALNREVEARTRAEALLRRQREVLEFIINDAPLSAVLENLMRAVEEHSLQGVLASVLLLDEEGRLRHGAAPSLPPDYIRAIDGLKIGPLSGSCGTAAFRAQPVMVYDILADPLWTEYRALAAAAGLRACWSVPILSKHGKCLGTFAMYYREPRRPSAADWELVALVTRTASIAIEKARVEEERRAKDEALRRSEKLGAAGRLAASIAHEINNPLEAVTNLLFLARHDPSASAKVVEYLAMADQELQRVSHIARQTLGFYRDSSAPSTFNLSDAINDVVRLHAKKIAARSIRVETRLDDPGEITAFVGEVRQVISNLITNAIDASPPGGRVVVHVSRAQTHAQPPPVRLTVADQGSGIPPEHLERIFEPFFTTKKHSGTGLGLWVSKSIVEKHGGVIRLRSSVRPGRAGTAVSVTLPAVSTAVSMHAPTAA